MVAFRMKIAGAVAEIQSLFDSTPQYFRAYLTGETPDFSFAVTPDHLRFEQEELDREAEEEGFRFRTFTDPFLERAAIQRAFAEFLFDRRILLLHGSAVALDGKGYLFMARSGTGKSTHTRLWREAFGSRAVMINDDKPFVGLDEQGVKIFGSPWSGKHGLDSNIAAPLAGICLLERGGEDRIQRILPRDALAMLRKQAYCPAEKQEQFLKLTAKLAEKTPLWRMECTKKQTAALVAQGAMCASVTLRPFEERDGEAMLDLLLDPQVKETYMIPDFATRQAARPLWERLLKLSREETRFVRAICVGDKAVGVINDVDITGDELELGYALLPEHWGRGYATAALKIAVADLFAWGFQTVKAAAFEDNIASMRVMEKAGMVLTGQTESVFYRDKERLCICYEIKRKSEEDTL